MTSAGQDHVDAAPAPGGGPWPGRARRAGIVGLLAAPIVVALAVRFPLCPTAATLGVPCPGCGLTRATLALLHGHLLEALHFHPLVLLVAPIYVTVAALGIFGYVRGPTTRPRTRLALAVDRALGPWAMVTIVLLLAVWVARFAGFFGGPAPVETLRAWRSSHVEAEVHHVAVPHDVVLPFNR